MSVKELPRAPASVTCAEMAAVPGGVSWLHEMVKKSLWHWLSSAYLLWDVGQFLFSPWVLCACDMGARLLSTSLIAAITERESKCQASLGGSW